MPRNIELKARVPNLLNARQAARRIATYHSGEFRQLDTYFDCRRGRLKLRESFGRAELIAYERPDDAGQKASDYRVVPCADAAELKAALELALGVRIVVDKVRDLYLWDNVRIHLDTVKNLGEFVEFEAVLTEGQADADGRAKVERLTREFGIAPDDLETGSYADLLEERLKLLA